ncbi:ATP-binding protein [Flexivirga caeni]|uniref:ATP-binding protein n=1 Tax=Flexivirga caeni TaxID=2294115 RepID=A0A3M9LYA2_9MICO|nr:ATP-binding protein [Flexivirga caeni]RNI18274.1 ATP-binding protein [Flexivirga caeni]
MDPIRNPYTPNAGAPPAALVGRDDQLQSFDLLLARLERRRSEQSMIITGLRGVGKTVLLGEFREKALSADWVVVEVEVSKHDELGFRTSLASKLRTAMFELSPRSEWTAKLRHAMSVLKSFTVSVDSTGVVSAGLDIEAAEGFADHGRLDLDLTDLFVAVGEAAQDRSRGVVLLFDEVQFLNRQQLEAIIMALHKLVQRRLPVTLVGAGLPQIAELAGDAKSYAERLFKFPGIGNLTEQAARRALAEPAEAEGVAFTDEALHRALTITGRYPYFLQELGSAAWASASGSEITPVDIDHCQGLYVSKLDGSFFRVRIDRCTNRQRQYLRAMAELGGEPQKAQDVAALLGRQSSQVAPFRAELISMGLLYTPEHGYAAFTVPRFDQYMKRILPTFEVPS